MQVDSIQLDTKPRSRDYDAGDGLNIISHLSHDTLAYPFYSVNYVGKDKVASLTIADSYYYEIAYPFATTVFEDVSFWYYFLGFWSHTNRTSTKGNIKNDLLNYKVVCLLYTDGSLANFGSGFIQTATTQFKEGK